MSFFNNFILDIKREKTPFHKTLKKIAGVILRPTAPRVPEFLKPLLRLVYETHYGVIVVWRTLTVFYRHPLFQARCASFGRNVSVDSLPFVSGHTEIHIGDNCYIGGRLSIMSGRHVDRPKFVMKDHAEIGWNSVVVVGKEVVIEEHARVSFNCRISDNDGHPRQADLRAAGNSVRVEDIRPVRIGKYAWVGNGSYVMKGVTIGEGAIIGANSVVISDIPPYSLALGNPAEVFLRGFGKPSRKAAAPTAAGESSASAPTN